MTNLEKYIEEKAEGLISFSCEAGLQYSKFYNSKTGSIISVHGGMGVGTIASLYKKVSQKPGCKVTEVVLERFYSGHTLTIRKKFKFTENANA